jgi:hypothetical protein
MLVLLVLVFAGVPVAGPIGEARDQRRARLFGKRGLHLAVGREQRDDLGVGHRAIGPVAVPIAVSIAIAIAVTIPIPIPVAVPISLRAPVVRGGVAIAVPIAVTVASSRDDAHHAAVAGVREEHGSQRKSEAKRRRCAGLSAGELKVHHVS